MTLPLRQREAQSPIDTPIDIGLAEEGDWPEIAALLDQPMDGDLRLCLARRPDPRLAAAIEGDRHTTVVGRDPESGRVLGVGCRAVRPMWIDGRVVRVGYLGQLRHSGELRTAGRLLRHGFARLDEERRGDEAPFDYTSILAGNRRARRLLERGLPGLPTYRPVGSMLTLLFRAGGLFRSAGRSETGRGSRRHPGTRWMVRPAGDGELAEVARCLERAHRDGQLAPVWTQQALRDPSLCRDLEPHHFVVLEEGDRIAGVAALWDQRAFKQIRLAGYSRRVARLRPLVNLLQRTRGGPLLPAPGELALGFVSHLAVDDDHPGRARALLAAIKARAGERGLSLLAVGLGADHPLVPTLRRSLRPYVLESVIYLVHRKTADGRQAGESARFDSRLPLQPEIAVL